MEGHARQRRQEGSFAENDVLKDEVHMCETKIGSRDQHQGGSAASAVYPLQKGQQTCTKYPLLRQGTNDDVAQCVDRARD